MDKWELFMRLGFDHITDFEGFDHMLFLLALCAVYQLADWRRWLLAITFFTIGHSLTLFISGMDYLTVNADWIEFLIPVTIFMTGVSNLTKMGQNRLSKLRPILAGIFGLIHGFGFSNYFRMVMIGEDSALSAILYFTLGIEIGQVLIVLIILVLAWALFNAFSVKMRDWNLFVTGIVTGLSVVMMVETFPGF
ncbi:MAG: HupE/UreJ family protein [Schleiferiaceae bacterium]|nr:HupE/UreJ family protein [Schleiferiaceae bacterium]